MAKKSKLSRTQETQLDAIMETVNRALMNSNNDKIQIRLEQTLSGKVAEVVQKRLQRREKKVSFAYKAGLPVLVIS